MRTEHRAARMRAPEPGRVEGFIPYGAATEELPGLTEIIRPGAFARTLESGADVLALLHHDPAQILGRSSARTLSLEDGPEGLRFLIDLPDTGLGRDTATSVERGDFKGASFAFVVPDDSGERWTVEGDTVTRELLDVDLKEVSITAIPAYSETTVVKRALERLVVPVRLSLAKRYLETI